MSWRWVLLDTVLAAHDRQLAEHGGTAGVRDLGLVESALARPQHLAAYGDPTAAELAAVYAHGIIKNHGFVDGNKRTAYVTSRVFLELNGHTLTAPPEERVIVFEAVGAGRIDADALRDWFTRWVVKKR